MRQILFVIFLIACIAYASAREQTITWNPNPEEFVVGYKVFIREYDAEGNPGPVDAYAAVEASPEPFIKGEFPDGKFGVFVVAVDAEGFESDMSEELKISDEISTPGRVRVVSVVEEFDGKEWKPLSTWTVEIDPETGRKFFKTVTQTESP